LDYTQDESGPLALENTSMSDHILKKIEVVETRGEIRNGGITYFQVTLKIGFRLNDEAA
jgi:flavin-binding protein dodecin